MKTEIQPTTRYVEETRDYTLGIPDDAPLLLDGKYVGQPIRVKTVHATTTRNTHSLGWEIRSITVEGVYVDEHGCELELEARRFHGTDDHSLLYTTRDLQGWLFLLVARETEV